MKTNQEIESAVRNYYWLVREVERLRAELGIIGSPEANKTGPGSKTGRPHNPTLNEVVRREHKQEALENFEKKIEYVDRNTVIITNDRELTVLNCLLDGMNINTISRHMGYSKRTIYSIKENIIEKIRKHAENNSAIS